MSARTEGPVEQLVDHLADPLFVRPSDDQGASTAEDLANGHDLAGQILAPRQHDAERLVQHDLGAAVQLGEHIGHRRDPHLAATGVDVDRVVVVDPEDGAVRRRWLGELLDLFAQRRDVHRASRRV